MKPRGEEEEEEGAAGGGDPWKECAEVAVQLALRAGQVRAVPRRPPQREERCPPARLRRGGTGPGRAGNGRWGGPGCSTAGASFPGGGGGALFGLSVKKGRAGGRGAG